MENKNGKNMEENTPKHPGGRPSEYAPEIINEINKYLEEAVPENMKIPTVEGIALKLGISKKTLYNWADEHEEFLHALEKLKMKQKEALTEIGIFGGKEINATIVSLLLKVNHDMIEKSAVDLTSGGKPIPIMGGTSNVHGDDGISEDSKAS